MAVAEGEENCRASRLGRRYSICLRDYSESAASGIWQSLYAAYGGIFIVSAVIWGRVIDKKKPDKYEIISSIVAIVGALVIFYAPRG
jgi:drug/metabolite transporter superfamily protein YnfA